MKAHGSSVQLGDIKLVQALKIMPSAAAIAVSPSQRTKGEELPKVLSRTARPLRSKIQHARACGSGRCSAVLVDEVISAQVA